MVIRRRYPILVRLARIDRELELASRLFGFVRQDLTANRDDTLDTQDRVTMVVAVVGALLMVAGSDGQMVGDWLVEMKTDGDIELADELGTDLVAQLMLRHSEPEGEA